MVQGGGCGVQGADGAGNDCAAQSDMHSGGCDGKDGCDHGVGLLFWFVYNKKAPRGFPGGFYADFAMQAYAGTSMEAATTADMAEMRFMI